MKILLVGCGNLGSAILKGMLSSGKFNNSSIDVILPVGSQSAAKINSEFGVSVYSKYPEQNIYDVILFAVKPQILEDILPTYKNFLNNPYPLIVSIAAGKTLAFYENFFPDFAIVRTMPNINAYIGESATIAIGNKNINSEHFEYVNRIFEAVGSIDWIEDENLIDVVIGIAGSSPAYFFQFIEHLIDIGINNGLSPTLANSLAKKSFIGSAKTIDQSEKSLKELRESVTSPNGTTLEALEVFNNNNNLYNLIDCAFKAAVKRSKELSKLD